MDSFNQYFYIDIVHDAAIKLFFLLLLNCGEKAKTIFSFHDSEQSTMDKNDKNISMPYHSVTFLLSLIAHLKKMKRFRQRQNMWLHELDDIVRCCEWRKAQYNDFVILWRYHKPS